MRPLFARARPVPPEFELLFLKLTILPRMTLAVFQANRISENGTLTANASATQQPHDKKLFMMDLQPEEHFIEFVSRGEKWRKKRREPCSLTEGLVARATASMETVQDFHLSSFRAGVYHN